MITQSEITAYLQNYLQVALFQDYAPNGLQVAGRVQIKKICTAVTASLEVIEEACRIQADALLVHHGYFWRGEDPVVCGMKAKRLKALLTHDLNLFAYHLPLDCHLELGNNACLGQMLNVQAIQTHTAGKTPHLLWSGQLLKPLKVSAFIEQLEHVFFQKPHYVEGRASDTIESIAWCSGAAQDFIQEAYDLGVDAYLSGEISERTYYQARELKIDYFGCGHHATERSGVRALGEHLQQTFGLEHHFIDVSNPI